MKSLPIRDLEGSDQKSHQAINLFQHGNISSSILSQIVTLISLAFYMGKWISIKI